MKDLRIKPSQLKDLDLKHLRAQVQEYLDYLDSDDPNPDRASKYEHYIFEVALETVIGAGHWDWINNKLDS